MNPVMFLSFEALVTAVRTNSPGPRALDRALFILPFPRDLVLNPQTRDLLAEAVRGAGAESSAALTAHDLLVKAGSDRRVAWCHEWPDSDKTRRIVAYLLKERLNRSFSIAAWDGLFRADDFAGTVRSVLEKSVFDLSPEIQ